MRSLSSPGSNDPSVGSRSSWLLWVAASVSAIGVALVMATLLFHQPSGADSPTYYQDFNDTVWRPVRYFLDGGVPYDSYAWSQTYPEAQPFLLYSPHSLLLTSPFAALPWSAAVTVWTVVLALSLGVTAVVALLRSGWTVTPARASLASVFMVVTQPGRFGLAVGQVGVLSASGAAWALAAESTWLAAIGTMLGWMKPTVGISLFFVLLALGRYRIAFLGTSAAAALSVPIVWVLVDRSGGPQGFFDILRRNLETAESTMIDGSGLGSPWSTDLPSALLRQGLPLGSVGRTLLMITMLVLSVGAVRFVHVRLPGSAWELSCAAAATLSVFPLFMYSAPVGIVGLLALGREASRSRGPMEIAGVVAWFLIFLSTASALDLLGLRVPAHYLPSLLIVLLLSLGVLAAAKRPESNKAVHPLPMPL